jgi:putative tricarboxylic transport membrane protein
MFENILAALPILFSVKALIFIVLGLTIGFIFGALPGLSSSNACALVLPMTIGMDLDVALIFFSGIYCGAQYGGSVPAILVNTPGTAGAAATALDGYQMALRGEASRAIGISRMASMVGGVISGVIVLVIIGPISDIALKFGPVELFLIAFLGLTLISTTVSDDTRKSILSAAIGFLIAAMSGDPYYGNPRLTFGFMELYEGLPFVPVLVGLFAVTEMFFLSGKKTLIDDSGSRVSASLSDILGVKGAFDGIMDTLKRPFTILSATIVGMVLGITPGIGTAVANFVSYGVARGFSKKPEQFGKGIPEGVIASEACDNAVCGGAMVPSFTLGLPGSTTAAIMLSAFYLHGILPGPQVMVKQAPMVYSVLLSIILSSVLILPLGILLSAPLLYIVHIKPKYLVSIILFLCTAGIYSISNSMFNVFVMFIFGLIGLLMRINNIPAPPLVIALILGPIAEQNFVRAYLLADGDLTYFFGSPISIIIWVIIIVALLYKPLMKIVRGRAR